MDQDTSRLFYDRALGGDGRASFADQLHAGLWWGIVLGMMIVILAAVSP